MQELNGTKYTCINASKHAESIVFLYQILRFTRLIDKGTIFDYLLQIYYYFETFLRVILISSNSFTTIEVFVRQLIAKRNAWFDQYKLFEKQLYIYFFVYNN